MLLNYEKPGYQSCDPVTIVYHGMIIQLKLNPPDLDQNEPKKTHRASKRLLNSEKWHKRG